MPDVQETVVVAPKLTKEEKAAAKALAKKQADDAKAAAKVAADAEKAKPVEKPPKDTQNGVTRPGAGVTRKVWEKADEMSASKSAPVDRAELSAALNGQIETGTIHTQYGRWRKYYGLSESKESRQARLQVAKDAKAATKAAEKEIKDKAKADAAKAAEAAKAGDPVQEPTSE